MNAANERPHRQQRPIVAGEPQKDRHFLGELGFAVEQLENSVVGAVAITNELCTPGTDQVRSGVLCTLADVVGGRLAASRTSPRLSITVDLACVIFSAPPNDRIIAEACILKAGKTTTVTETRFYSWDGPPEQLRPGGRPFANCIGTFVASGNPADLLPSTRSAMIPISGSGFPVLERPILERLGSVGHSPGVLETRLTPEILNSAGILQGGAVALLADDSAQSAATAHAGVNCPVFDLDIHFLDALRIGPVRSSAEMVGETVNGTTMWRVELRDLGMANRLGTVALARCRPE
jgi:acyl-coenzyme A thioesterase PaaI-like protein